jgi:hypothetical protein
MVGLFVRRSFGDGSGVRFGVTEREAADRPAELQLSTGAAGEFQRQGRSGLYFADQRGDAPAAVREAERQSQSLWRPDALTIGALAVGGFLALLGLLVVLRKGPQGLIEVLLGGAIMATPFVIRAKERRDLRERLEKERAARAEIDRRNRDMAEAFAETLGRLTANPGKETLAAVRSEREGKDIPYAAVAPLTRQTVRSLGFGILSALPDLPVEEAARRIEETIEAVGLSPEDTIAVKVHLLRRVLWHLLADDRLTQAHEELFRSLQKALAVPDETLVVDLNAALQFGELRKIRREALPAGDCGTLTLKYREICHLSMPGKRMKLKKEKGGALSWAPVGDCQISVTSRRLWIPGGKGSEVPLQVVDLIELDADEGILTVTEAGSKKPMVFTAAEPLKLAMVLELAAERARQANPFL